MKLSKTQLNVLKLMEDKKAYIWNRKYNNYVLQDGSPSGGGRTYKITLATVRFLMNNNLIEKIPNQQFLNPNYYNVFQISNIGLEQFKKNYTK